MSLWLLLCWFVTLNSWTVALFGGVRVCVRLSGKFEILCSLNSDFLMLSSGSTDLYSIYISDTIGTTWSIPIIKGSFISVISEIVLCASLRPSHTKQSAILARDNYRCTDLLANCCLSYIVVWYYIENQVYYVSIFELRTVSYHTRVSKSIIGETQHSLPIRLYMSLWTLRSWLAGSAFGFLYVYCL